MKNYQPKKNQPVSKKKWQKPELYLLSSGNNIIEAKNPLETMHEVHNNKQSKIMNPTGTNFFVPAAAYYTVHS